MNFSLKSLLKIFAIFRVLKTERETPTPSHIAKEYSWIDGDNSDMVQRTDPLGNRSMYVTHSYPKLKEVPVKRIVDIENNLKDLKQVAQR